MRARVGVKEYGVLYAHASETTIPGLVVGPFPDIVAATAEAAAVHRAQPGSRSRLVRRVNGGAWATLQGESPEQALLHWQDWPT